MSTFSEAWHSMDPELRNFYVSWSQIHTAQNWHVVWDPDWEYWTGILLFAAEHVGWLGYHLAQKNWTQQIADHGSFDINYCWLRIPQFSWAGILEPVRDAFDFDNYESFPLSNLDYTSINTYVDPPTDPPTEEEPFFWANNLPRLKYKIRRSYWTGAPRRRRNN